jgi:Cu(I)/Ag(I) efflux system membrane protein CusA/SilA
VNTCISAVQHLRPLRRGAQLGIKILGSDLSEIEKVGEQIEMVLKDIPGTTSVFAERTTGGYFLDFDLKRDQLARYGLTVDDANNVLMSAVGGEPVTITVEGRERYTVNVRYLRDYRSDSRCRGLRPN